jgi:hypothetical protein
MEKKTCLRSIIASIVSFLFCASIAAVLSSSYLFKEDALIFSMSNYQTQSSSRESYQMPFLRVRAKNPSSDPTSANFAAINDYSAIRADYIGQNRLASTDYITTKINGNASPVSIVSLFNLSTYISDSGVRKTNYGQFSVYGDGDTSDYDTTQYKGFAWVSEKLADALLDASSGTNSDGEKHTEEQYKGLKGSAISLDLKRNESDAKGVGLAHCIQDVVRSDSQGSIRLTQIYGDYWVLNFDLIYEWAPNTFSFVFDQDFLNNATSSLKTFNILRKSLAADDYTFSINVRSDNDNLYYESSKMTEDFVACFSMSSNSMAMSLVIGVAMLVIYGLYIYLITKYLHLFDISVLFYCSISLFAISQIYAMVWYWFFLWSIPLLAYIIPPTCLFAKDRLRKYHAKKG